MNMRSLTQSEAERRAVLLTVDGYDIELDLTGLPEGPTVRARSIVTFTCREPGAQTFVDCAARVVSATLNGAELGPAELPSDGRITLSGLAEHNTLCVETVQDNTRQGEGIHRAVDPADGEVYVWTCFAPNVAHHLYACFDQPDLKAPHTFTVIAPPQWTVTSNSAVERVESGTWMFPPTPPLSTYNTVVNAGPLHEIRREVDGHDLGLFARRSLASVLERDADELFTLTRQGLAFFAEVFQMPYPQRKYDQVFMPEFGGAMENYGCVTYTDTLLRRAAPTPAERELLAAFLLHEMAHMWFGNIVTMRWWDDLWLNEAFAEFACNWAAARATAYTDAWAGHLAMGKIAAYLADQGPGTHPIHQPIRDVAQAASIFDAITYPKGASVLHQLMQYVGEEAFTTGMSAYFARHAWGNTTLRDLIDALAASSGRDLDAWTAGWLQVAGTDRITLRKGLVEASGPGGGPPRPQVLAVGAYSYANAGDAMLRRTALARLEIRDRVTEVDLPPGADLYLINDEDLTFATTRPDSKEALIGAAGALPTAISRGVAVATVWDMLLCGEASAADAVRCLTGVLAVETSGAVIEPYLRLAIDACEAWAPSAAQKELTATVAHTCRALAGDEGRRRAALRALAWTAGDMDEVAWLRAQAGDDVDLLWRALVRQAELGAPVEAEIAELLDRDTDPDAWVRAVTVRAAMPDADEKAKVWQTVAVERSVPIGSVALVLTAFWRPGQDAVLRPYAQRFMDMVPDLHLGGMIPAMMFAKWLFPLYTVDSGYLDRAQAEADRVAPVVGKNIIERVDLLRRMLRSRG